MPNVDQENGVVAEEEGEMVDGDESEIVPVAVPSSAVVKVKRVFGVEIDIALPEVPRRPLLLHPPLGQDTLSVSLSPRPDRLLASSSENIVGAVAGMAVEIQLWRAIC